MSTHTEAASQSTKQPARAALLRGALELDAVVSGANGALYLAAAGPLGGLLGVPPSILREAGAFLVVFAALVWLAGTRPAIPRAGAVAIVAVNALWAGAGVAAAATGWQSPEALGTAWIVLQALVVGGFAEAQMLGLRRARP